MSPQHDPASPVLSPEILLRLEKAEADIDAGKALTLAEVRERIRDHSAEWVQNNPHIFHTSMDVEGRLVE